MFHMAQKLEEIKGYKDYYIGWDGKVRLKTEEGYSYVKQYRERNGSMFVCIRRKGLDRTFSVHRLVAMAFLPEGAHKRYVIHLDGDKSNNHYKNLMWTDDHPLKGKKASGLRNKKSGTVYQFNLDGYPIGEYKNPLQASKQTGASYEGVRKCLSGEFKQTSGFIFSYDKDFTIEESLKGRKPASKKRGVTQFSIEGKFMGNYKSAKHAAEAVYGSQSAIQKASKEGYGKSAGFIWGKRNAPEPRIAVYVNGVCEGIFKDLDELLESNELLTRGRAIQMLQNKNSSYGGDYIEFIK